MRTEEELFSYSPDKNHSVEDDNLLKSTNQQTNSLFDREKQQVSSVQTIGEEVFPNEVKQTEIKKHMYKTDPK